MIHSKAFPLSRSEFYVCVMTLAAIYKASITSGIRTSTRNRAKGGNPRSHHLTGFAFDLVPDDYSRAGELVRAAQACGFDAVDEKDHVHIEHDPKG